MEEHVPAPKRVCTSFEDLEECGLAAICLGCMSLLKGSARHAHAEKCQRRIEEELRGIWKAEAAHRRMKEY